MSPTPYRYLALCLLAAFFLGALTVPFLPTSASGSATLDGIRDVVYLNLAADPSGDLANPGPGGWSGTAWTDQTNLYCQNDATYLYIYADLPNYNQSTSAGQIGLLIDTGTAAGGSADPWGNAITFGHSNKPDYVIRGNIPGIEGGNGWTELRTWDGAAWSAGGTNWGGIASGAQIGSKIGYSNANGVEFKIPLADIGNPTGTLNLEFFATQNGATKGAYDTVPSDDQSTGWDDATTLVHYAACVLDLTPPTSTPEPTATPAACSSNTVGDGVIESASVYHDNQDSTYREPVGSVPMNQNATVRLRTCHADIDSVQVLVWTSGEPLGSPGTTLNLTASQSGSYDLWEVQIPAPPTLIDQWYQFKLTDGATVGYYHPANGNLGPGVYYTAASQQNPSWSLPRHNTTTDPTPTPGAPPPPSCTGAALGDNTIATGQIYHLDTDPAYRDPLGNISVGASAELIVRTCKNDVSSLTAWVWKTGAGATPSFTYNAVVTSTDATYDYWWVRVPVPSEVIDQWYQFKLTDGSLSGYFHPVSGNTGPGTWTSGVGSSWKLGTNSGPALPVTGIPSWIDDAVIYQIFPDRFRDGNSANNALIEGTEVYGNDIYPGCDGYPHARPAGHTDGCIHDLRGWNEGLLNPSWGLDFYGGDLQGITEKINAGYFDELGVNTLYLNPIFEASSNHGYDTNDYYTVEQYFGGDAAFDAFMAAAQAHNLRVILDGVFNHTGMDSAYIDWDKNNNGACASATSPFRSWFTLGGQGLNFGCADGWGWKGWYNYATIPELVDDNADVRDFFFKGGSPQIPAAASGKSVSQYWLEKGISGWRYDVAQDISHSWFEEMRPYIKGDTGTWGNPEFLMLGEVTGGCASGGLYESYTRGDELDSVMNYCFRDWIAGYASGNPPSVFNNSFNDFRSQYAPEIANAMMNLMSTHDSQRIYNLIGGNYDNFKFAVLTQMTLPGAPSVYYGDEIGLQGGGDPDNRRTYPWSDTPNASSRTDYDTSGTLFNTYKTLIGIRNLYPALRGGDFTTLLVDNNTSLYSYLRSTAEQKIVVILKNTAGGATATVPVGAHFANNTILVDVLNGNTQYTVSGGEISVPVSGKWGAILVAQPTQKIYLPGIYSFFDDCVQVNFSDVGSLTQLSASLTLNDPTVPPTDQPLPRHFHLQGNASDFTGSLSLCYQDGEIPSGLAETDLHLYRYVGAGVWQQFTSTVYTVNNRVSANITGFSDWTIAGPGYEPSALQMLSADADSREGASVWVFASLVVVALALGIFLHRKAIHVHHPGTR